MHALAEELEGGSVVQERGTVVQAGDGLAVRTDHGRYEAKRAFSCLVEPSEGDHVLVATSPAGHAWVLAILERPTDTPAVLRTEGDMHLELPEGRFRIVSKAMDLVATSTMRLASHRTSVQAREGAFFLDRSTVVGEAADVSVDRVKTFAKSVDQVVGRLSQKLERSYRFVREMDVTRSRQIDTRAEQNWLVRARNAIIGSDQLVKVDGEQIHLG